MLDHHMSLEFKLLPADLRADIAREVPLLIPLKDLLSFPAKLCHDLFLPSDHRHVAVEMCHKVKLHMHRQQYFLAHTFITHQAVQQVNIMPSFMLYAMGQVPELDAAEPAAVTSRAQMHLEMSPFLGSRFKRYFANPAAEAVGGVGICLFLKSDICICTVVSIISLQRMLHLVCQTSSVGQEILETERAPELSVDVVASFVIPTLA